MSNKAANSNTTVHPHMNEPQLFSDYLSEKINASSVKQSDIAAEIGVSSPNIITMYKQNKSRVPLNRVRKLAKVLDIDEKALMRKAMLEYEPELLRDVEAVFGEAISRNEKNILDEIRRLTNNSDPAMTSIKHKQALEAFVKALQG